MTVTSPGEALRKLGTERQASSSSLAEFQNKNAKTQNKNSLPTTFLQIERRFSPIPCKKINPEIKTGCQLNSAGPPSQAKPSLKRRTHTSASVTQTKPTAAAELTATTKCLKLCIAISVQRRDGATEREQLLPQL